MKNLLALGLLVAATASHATVFEVPITGTFTVNVDPESSPGACDDYSATTCEQVLDFSGLMTVIAPDVTDGTVYGGVRVSYALPWSGYDMLQGFDMSTDSGWGFVTVKNGQLIDLVVQSVGDYQWINVSGGSLTFDAQVSHGSAEAQGVYSLATESQPLGLPSAVPEPLNLSLMGLGAAFVAFSRRQKRHDKPLV